MAVVHVRSRVVTCRRGCDCRCLVHGRSIDITLIITNAAAVCRYLYVRVVRNPMAYGIPWDQKDDDPMMQQWCASMVEDAAKRLDDCRMIRFDKKSGNLAVTALGRTASHYYLKFPTIKIFNKVLHSHMTYTDCIAALCSAEEFAAIKYVVASNCRCAACTASAFVAGRCDHCSSSCCAG